MDSGPLSDLKIFGFRCVWVNRSARTRSTLVEPIDRSTVQETIYRVYSSITFRIRKLRPSVV